MTIEFKISTNNAKLKKDGIASYNLPAGKSAGVTRLKEINAELVKRGYKEAFPQSYIDYRETYEPNGVLVCIGAGPCFGICYAQQGTFNFLMSIVAREKNLMQILTNCEEYKKEAIAKLSRTKKDIRVHDSGDFFNQDYLNFWADIAKALPNKRFYAYTKSLKLDFSVLPKNFKITQSEGGLHDKHINKRKSHARIFSSHEARKKAGYQDGNKSDMLAYNGVQKIGLVYHGGKNLTEKQIKHFS